MNINIAKKPLGLFCVALAVSATAVTYAQPAISISTEKSGKARSFVAGEISVSGDIPAIETKSFTCTPVRKFKKGDKVATMTSADGDQAWSVEEHSFRVGTNQVAYPILALVKCSDGAHGLFPSVLKINTDIRVGETLKSDGYQIEAMRAVKAGESISVLRSGESLLSVETADAGKDRSEAKPWFTAFKDDVKASARAALVEAWRTVNEHVGR
jgi:hypothetical protein